MLNLDSAIQPTEAPVVPPSHRDQLWGVTVSYRGVFLSDLRSRDNGPITSDVSTVMGTSVRVLSPIGTFVIGFLHRLADLRRGHAPSPGLRLGQHTKSNHQRD